MSKSVKVYKATTGYHDVSPGILEYVAEEVSYNNNPFFKSPPAGKLFNEIQTDGDATYRAADITAVGGNVSDALFMTDSDFDKKKLIRSHIITKDMPVSSSDNDIKLVQGLIIKDNDGTKPHPLGGTYPKVVDAAELTRILALITLPAKVKALVDAESDFNKKLNILAEWRQKAAGIFSSGYKIFIDEPKKGKIKIYGEPNASFELESTTFDIPVGGGAGSGASSTLVATFNAKGIYNYDYEQPPKPSVSNLYKSLKISVRFTDKYGYSGTGSYNVYDQKP